MRKITFTLLAIFALGLTMSLSAQKPFAGTIKSKVSCEGTTDANFLSQLPGESTEVVCGNRTKVTQIIQEGFGVISITNGDNKILYTIFDIAGMGKYYIEINADSLAAEKTKHPTKDEIVYTEETKTIAGYQCKKVNYISTDLETDEETTTILYVTTDICPGGEVNFATFPDVKGFPLRTERKIDYQGDEVTIITEAFEIVPSKKIKPVEFLLPTDALSIYDNPELMKMLGMGGGDDEE